MAGGGPGHVHTDLLTLLLLWGCLYASAVLAHYTKLSPLLFYIVFGCIFTNTGVLPEHPSEFMTTLSELAITIVFFALGLEENMLHFLGGIKKAWGIASVGALVPFACGWTSIRLMFPDAPWQEPVMAGLAVTATAVSLTMIALKAEGLATSKPAIGIITSAVLDDIACLAVVAVMVPLLVGDGVPGAGAILWTVGKALLFFVLIVVLHVLFFPRLLPPLLKFKKGDQASVVVLSLGLGIGMVALLFGFHPAIGAYMCGLIIEEKYFDLPPEGEAPDAVHLTLDTQDVHGNSFHHTQEIVEDAAFQWLGPVFFFLLGGKIIIEVDVLAAVVPQIVVCFLLLFFGQIASAGLSARFLPGGFTNGESLMIGIGMLGRAELFFVVLDIGYIQNPVFSKDVFYVLMFTAMLLNISVPVCISLYKPYFVGEKLPPKCLQGKFGIYRPGDPDANPGGLAPSLRSNSEISLPGVGDDFDVKEVSIAAMKAQKEYFKADHRAYRRPMSIANPAVLQGLTPALLEAHQSGDEVVMQSYHRDSGQALAAAALQALQGQQMDDRPAPLRSMCGMNCNPKVCVLCRHLMVASESSRIGAGVAEPDAFLQLVYEDKRIQRDLSASDPNMAGRGSSDPRMNAMRAKPKPKRNNVAESVQSDDAQSVTSAMTYMSDDKWDSASMSGATGSELTREVRQYIDRRAHARPRPPKNRGSPALASRPPAPADTPARAVETLSPPPVTADDVFLACLGDTGKSTENGHAESKPATVPTGPVRQAATPAASYSL
jgi:Kef-type K+ transport system membrane component KefB